MRRERHTFASSSTSASCDEATKGTNNGSFVLVSTHFSVFSHHRSAAAHLGLCGRFSASAKKPLFHISLDVGYSNCCVPCPAVLHALVLPNRYSASASPLSLEHTLILSSTSPTHSLTVHIIRINRLPALA